MHTACNYCNIAVVAPFLTSGPLLQLQLHFLLHCHGQVILAKLAPGPPLHYSYTLKFGSTKTSHYHEISQ